RVILPDSHLHGERKENISQTELELAFWEVVEQNIKELADIREYITAKKLTIPEKIGIGGTSMGGITTYGALKQYDWIQAAASLMGTPKMTTYAQWLIDHFNATNEKKITETEAKEVIEHLTSFDLSINPENLNERPLFIWHGNEDEVVPSAHDVSFYEEMRNQYSNKDHLYFILEKGRGHHISRLSIAEIAKWFKENL